MDDAHRQYATTDRLAARGTLYARYARTAWFAWVATRMDLPAGARVLDVGCGPAWFWRSAAPRLPAGLHLTLADASPSMIAAARRQDGLTDRSASLSFAVADAAALPFPDASFDAALAMHVLYHAGEPRRALGELRRVLRPGGRAFVTTNAVGNMRELGVLSAQIFGGSGRDRGAARFSLDDSERLMSEMFAHVRRHDLRDALEVTDPDDAAAYLLSMPPGDAADAATRERLASLLRSETVQHGGTLRITRHSGLVEGRREDAQPAAASA